MTPVRVKMFWLVIIFHDVGQNTHVEYVHPDPFLSAAQCDTHFKAWTPQADFTDLATATLGDVKAYLFAHACKTGVELIEAGVDLPNVRKVDS